MISPAIAAFSAHVSERTKNTAIAERREETQKSSLISKEKVNKEVRAQFSAPIARKYELGPPQPATRVSWALWAQNVPGGVPECWARGVSLNPSGLNKISSKTKGPGEEGAPDTIRPFWEKDFGAISLGPFFSRPLFLLLIKRKQKMGVGRPRKIGETFKNMSPHPGMG